MCFTEFHRPFFTEIYISQPALLILLGIKIFTSFIHPGYICIDETLGFPQIKLKRHLIVWKINKKKIHQHERLWGFKYRHFKPWADHVESNIYIYGLPSGASGKEPACWCRRPKRDKGWIPGLGRFPGGGHGNPLQYSCLENPMDRGAWRSTNHGVTKSQTWLKRFSTQLISLVWIIIAEGSISV